MTDTLPALRESLRLTRWELGLGEVTENSEPELDTPDPELELGAVRTSGRGHGLQCDKCITLVEQRRLPLAT